MGKLGIIALTCIAAVLIGLGWTVTKLGMGVKWMTNAYKVGREMATGGGGDEHS